MVKPTGITADRNREILNINWSDGHETSFPFSELSINCPCASCNDERQKLISMKLDPVKDFKPTSTYIQHIEPVGSYAINIVWKDGCRYGIYTWDFLRNLAENHPETPVY